ncbi:MAG TPA: class I adenylate-forming enzyme family protein [Solirubrobacterales bacterium]|nr:class I adenylate-forming enzyme family protein [Solirubrobacterales bacterium]
MRPSVLAEDLGATARARPDAPAVVTAEESVSYADLDRRVDAAATELRRLGVARGDRVAIVMSNGIPMVVTVYAILRAGAAFSPISPEIVPAKLERILLDVGAAAAVCEAGTREKVSAAAPAGTTIVDGEAEATAEPGADFVPMVGPDLAAVIYTSGSTGEPKGVTLTHGNMSFVADSIIESIDMDGSDRILCVLPLYFGYGLYQLLACVRLGATLVLEPGLGAAGRIVQLFEEQRITGFAAVPTIYQLLLSLPGIGERELPHLRFLTNAGAGLPTPVVEAVREAFPGARLYLMYGQTECQRVCRLPPEEVDSSPDSVGTAIPGTEAWVEDEDGEVAAPGVVGELMVRGAHVMQGYWGNEEATARRLRPGRWPWERVLATGDLFRADDRGYLYFVGRRDDIIKSRGQKVAPREVEEVLHAFPGVRDAAVVGVPDRLLGEAVHAHVSAEAGVELDANELRRHCAESLESHMVPKRVVVHSELPRIGSGKIDRRTLAGRTTDG